MADYQHHTQYQGKKSGDEHGIAVMYEAVDSLHELRHVGEHGESENKEINTKTFSQES